MGSSLKQNTDKTNILKIKPFKKFKKGADFYASLIQNVIIVACFAIGFIFIMISLQMKKVVIVCGCLVIVLIMESILRVVYNSFEKII